MGFFLNVKAYISAFQKVCFSALRPFVRQVKDKAIQIILGMSITLACISGPSLLRKPMDMELPKNIFLLATDQIELPVYNIQFQGKVVI